MLVVPFKHGNATVLQSETCGSSISGEVMIVTVGLVPFAERGYKLAANAEELIVACLKLFCV